MRKPPNPPKIKRYWGVTYSPERSMVGTVVSSSTKSEARSILKQLRSDNKIPSGTKIEEIIY